MSRLATAATCLAAMYLAVRAIEAAAYATAVYGG